MNTVFGEDKINKKIRRGCAYMKKQSDRVQDIRMCIQTYFNLYGAVPTRQILVEWLGTSYEEMIPGVLNKADAA